MIELGQKVRDTVTGFVGTATSRHSYMGDPTDVYGLECPETATIGITYFGEHRLEMVASKRGGRKPAVSAAPISAKRGRRAAS